MGWIGWIGWVEEEGGDGCGGRCGGGVAECMMTLKGQPSALRNPFHCLVCFTVAGTSMLPLDLRLFPLHPLSLEV
jgi:hypothetical protein